MSSDIVIKQLAVKGLDDNFSYLLYSKATKEAAIVDPCGNAEVIRDAARAHAGLIPKYILLTHGHLDHRDALPRVKEFFDAPVAACSLYSGPVDIHLVHNQSLPFGLVSIECLHAPGHSVDSMVYRLSDDSAIFTGDTLFIDCCGYCEAKSMFKTLCEIIRPLADSNVVYPGHNYGHAPSAPLGEEKRSNPYLREDDFDKFKEELKKL